MRKPRLRGLLISCHIVSKWPIWNSSQTQVLLCLPSFSSSTFLSILFLESKNGVTLKGTLITYHHSLSVDKNVTSIRHLYSGKDYEAYHLGEFL